MTHKWNSFTFHEQCSACACACLVHGYQRIQLLSRGWIIMNSAKLEYNQFYFKLQDIDRSNFSAIEFAYISHGCYPQLAEW